MSPKKKLSIIVPTLNEAERLPLLLADINLCPYQFELFIVDGSSLDLSTFIAEIGGAQVLKTKEANRGDQLHKGACKASGDWLLFLHADCRLSSDWPSTINQIIRNPLNKKHGWFFDFKINRKGLCWFLLEKSVALRSNFFHKPYGDQGLLISKDLYFKIGGYRSLQIMEDLDLIKRLNKQYKLKRIGMALRTSSRKYHQSNIFLNSLENAILRMLWEKGVDVKTLAKKYYSTK
ncbi:MULTISPECIES: TIGR04283 family arsenosugar biosynthesis glycosyltransferase [unclassified Prochlorococcus]|uniref:TIGR04283 family arsenosugar biosynthesis glycosyltransferase n=1 Tax=unclassified Prochlorococcus TaxID=2627481 RepID=UPI0005336EE1|nr:MULTISPECIES: TIGR04283 family arsenosugar biosynthesis glycosyltransferase [unclassified Prochlorococcus]KGG17131.1 glycosyltransferase [Prochlorococcus sp. MIT 0603]